LIAGGMRYAHRVPRLYMLKGDTVLSAAEGSAVQLLTPSSPVQPDAVYDLADVPGLPPAWLVESPPTGAFEEWHGGVGFPIHDVYNHGCADIGAGECGLLKSYLTADYGGGIIVLY